MIDKTTPAVKTNSKLVARQVALAALIAQHPDDFHDNMAIAYEAKGLTYERPLTESEKAHKQILDLAAKHGLSVLPTREEITEVQAAKAAAPIADDLVVAAVID